MVSRPKNYIAYDASFFLMVGCKLSCFTYYLFNLLLSFTVKWKIHEFNVSSKHVSMQNGRQKELAVRTEKKIIQLYLTRLFFLRR